MATERLNSSRNSKLTSKSLQVQTALENPTRYHVIQKQKNQVRQYLSESFQSEDGNWPNLSAPSGKSMVGGMQYKHVRSVSNRASVVYFCFYSIRSFCFRRIREETSVEASPRVLSRLASLRYRWTRSPAPIDSIMVTATCNKVHRRLLQMQQRRVVCRRTCRIIDTPRY